MTETTVAAALATTTVAVSPVPAWDVISVAEIASWGLTKTRCLPYNGYDIDRLISRVIRLRREAERASDALWREYTQALDAWEAAGGGARPSSPESTTATRRWWAATDAARAASRFDATDDRSAIVHDALRILASLARMEMTRALLRALDSAWLAR